MEFKVGDKVVCENDALSTILSYNKVYTILHITKKENEQALFLKEIDAEFPGGYSSIRFRKLNETEMILYG